MSSGEPDLTVVIMLYNERATVRDVVTEIRESLESLARSWELLIVDDGSTDGSDVIVDELAQKDGRLRVIHHFPNGGLGSVYRTGFAKAQGRFVTYFPADGQFPGSILGEFRHAIDQHDLVLGFLHAGSRAWMPRVLSAAERALYRLLLGPMPRFQGILMYRRDMANRISFHSTGRGWGIVMELILRASREGWRIVSLPTTIRPRTVGRSKVNNLHGVVENLRQVMRLRRLLSEEPVAHA